MGPGTSFFFVGELFAEGGALGRVMSGIDWSATSLGSTEAWPPRLVEALRIVLFTEQPMAVFWGPEYTMLYNDGYADIIGSKHPGALGRSGRAVFPENWELSVAPLFETVWESRKPSLVTDRAFVIQRRGFLEQSYFDVSIQPLLLDDGAMGGVLCVVTETTARVLSERRLRLLAGLGARTAGLRTPQSVARTVAEMLDIHRDDVPFTAFYLVPEPGRLRLAASAAIPPEAAEAAREVRLDRIEETTGLAARLAAVVGDAAPARLPGALFSMPGEEALAHPLVRSDTVEGVLVMGINPRLPATAPYQDFFEVLAATVGAALSAARTQHEQRRRAESLAELDRAKTVFFSNISHEFRTPLTLILGPVQQALADEDRPARRSQLELAERSALRLLKLVNTLLDVSRVEAGGLKGTFEPVDLSRITAELAAIFRSSFDLAGLTLEVDCPPLPEPVHIDREMWEKIVLNLISNALKFTFTGGVTVRMAAVGHHARLTVSDTGSGIPREELPHLFERFHRVRGARSRSYEGSGVGLALVKDLVELHSGTIAVTSVPARGTEFTVEIPFGTAHLEDVRGEAPSVRGGTGEAERAAAYAQEARHWLGTAPSEPLEAEESPAGASGVAEAPVEAPFEAPSQAPVMAPFEAPIEAPESPYATGPAEPAPVRRPRLLVADDNADVRSYLGDLLGREHDVLLAADGRAALDTALAHPVDLVLTDVMMPRLDGFGLVRALRADPRTTRLPIIMLTARAGEESTVRGLGAGADDYLAKPFSARQLLARVSANLELSRLRERVLSDSRRQADMLTSLSQASLLLSDTLDPPQVLDTARELLVPALADEIRIRLADPRAERPLYAAGESVAPGGLLDRALGETLLAGTAPEPPATGGPLLAVPLLAHGRTLGALAIARREGVYTMADRQYLQGVAGRLALAYDNAARFRNERHLALTLQRALLPQHLPQVPGLHTASYYEASASGAEIGGDWYDVIALPDGEMGLAIGDVMGHDVDAATVMGRLRSTLRGFALDRASPGVLLGKLDAYLRSLDVDHFATCLYAVYEPRTRRLRYAASGHLPPLLVAGGTTSFLDVCPNAPLGLADEPPVGHETRLPPGAGLLLFTDGLVENSHLPLDDGLAALRRACDGLTPPVLADPQAIIDRALGLLDIPGRVDDDTALLAASAP
ncbi:SpoIIE family protein phosphatase [Streptomyces himastatinicus]|uniref:SpoIIE family protein phosphatase n=1 Tax=Streptomyces himastatinicus TaxID=998084 RepID=UPI000587F637|nr:SpoIIE family protein phosphatase [Streptomyces himastatinicus]